MELQNEEKPKICSLCLDLCNQNFEAVDNVTRQMLETLQLKPDPPISSDSVICSGCTRNLENCCTFRWSCLDTEDSIKSFASISDNAEVNIIEFYLSKSKNKNKVSVSEDRTVCRLCVKLVKCYRGVALNENTEVVTWLRISLNKYFPELNLNITQEPVLCTACHISLQEYIRFMENCSDEKDIFNRCEVGRSINNPEDIPIPHCPTGIPLKREHETSDGNLSECDFESKGRSLLKEENLVCMKTEDVDIKNEDEVKNEEIDIEMDESNSERNTEETPDNHQYEPCTYQSQNDLNTTPSFDTDVAIYQCKFCPFKANHKRQLKDHSRKHRDDIFHCQLCKYKTKRSHDLTKHMLVHQSSSEVTMYKCDICTFETKHKKNLKDHMRVHLNSDVLYSCEVCNFETKNVKRFNTHRSNHEASFSCELCGYKTKRNFDLKKHLLIHQDSSEVTMYQCEVCDFKTRHKNNMKKHVMLQRHSNNQCGICGYKAKRKSVLDAHRSSHESGSQEINYRCEVCGALFKGKFSLKRHLRLIHANDAMLHECDLCGYKTKHKHNLKAHVNAHSKGAGVVKEYRCAKCEFKTKLRGVLKVHLLSHKGEVYRCDVCSFETKRSRYCLEQHMRVHQD